MRPTHKVPSRARHRSSQRSPATLRPRFVPLFVVCCDIQALMTEASGVDQLRRKYAAERACLCEAKKVLGDIGHL